MKNKLLRGVLTAAAIACCSLCLLTVPAATMPVEAAAAETPASPQQDIKRWCYLELDGKLWKRLWNGTRLVWETDWIYVRDL